MADAPRTALSRGPAPLGELAARYFEELEEKVRLALAVCDDETLWWRPAPGVNAIGNLLIHLAGNLSLWVFHGLAGEAVHRHRAAELAADRQGSRDELLERLSEVLKRSAAIARKLPESELSRVREVQGYEVDGRAILMHAVEHTSYHTGQILTLTKSRLEPGRKLEFYPQHAGE